MNCPERLLLDEVLGRLKLAINREQVEQLLHYVELILQGLSRQRLVGSGSVRNIMLKHIYDSLYLLTVTVPEPGEMLDLGTGAGLPGVPLKICLSGNPLYLLDANRRKINFLRRVAEELNLKDVFFLPGRAEEWGREEGYRERFTVVFSRAVADAATLAELSLPLCKIKGQLFIYKGPRGFVEMNRAADALRICGGTTVNSWSYSLPSGERRTLFQVLKMDKTPHLYPRRAGLPLKKPLSGLKII